MKRDNIALIGFMGTGKSSVAAYLNQADGYTVVETDARIVQAEGQSIQAIFDRYGEAYFRDRESQILAELCRGKGQVISCGGGIVLRDQNVEQLRQSAWVVLLSATPETVYERLKGTKDRPLLTGRNTVAGIADLMEERRAKYEAAADFTVDTDGRPIPAIAQEILRRIKEME